MPNPEPKKARRVRLPGERGTVLVGGLVGIAIVGWLDWVIKAQFSFSTLYLLPICFVSWFLGIGAGLTAAVLAALVWLAVELYGWSPQYDGSAAVWQGGSRLVFFVVVSVLVSRVRGFKLHLEALVRERTAALEGEVVHRKELEREATEIADREQERVAHELHDQLAAYLSRSGFIDAITHPTLQPRNPGLPDAGSGLWQSGNFHCAQNKPEDR
jgi:signal transduction histidine kinase